MRPPLDAQRTVLIIGAADGLGRELARQLARRVRTLVLVTRDVARLEPLRDELLAGNPTLGVLLLSCDACRPADVDALVKHLEAQFIRVDVLVNNAAFGETGLYAEERWGRVEEMLRANVWMPALLTHRLLGPMLERGRGGILNIGSGASRFFLSGSAAFAATQHFVDAFTESLRLEVESRGVAVTLVTPGPLLDPGAQEALGGVAPFFRLSLARCAREALEGFARGEPLVVPGRGHRWALRLMALLPRTFKRGLGRLALRGLRRQALLSEQAPPLGAKPALVLSPEQVSR